MLKHTPLYDFHVAAGARMVDFAGWEMPIVYRSIVDEHVQTRNSGSMFDVSHMGRLRFSGTGATDLLDRALTRNIRTQAVGQCRYSLVCNESGGVLDDVIVSRDAKDWIVVCNASNREKLLKHFAALANEIADVKIDDQTEATAMIALQGPKVIERLSEFLPIDLAGIKRYHFINETVMFVKLQIFRSGYTGEDGIEIVMSARAAAKAVALFADKPNEPGGTIMPAGLGARDTLRLEAGMPLYGHELDELTDPLSAGLGWAVDLTKDFLGSGAVRKIQENGPARKLVGLELAGRRIARQGANVHGGGWPADAPPATPVVGRVTSGTLSPTLDKSIAMAYVDRGQGVPGEEMAVDLKGASQPARVVAMPFYKRQEKR
jgi:aminomethyltransferase